MINSLAQPLLDEFNNYSSDDGLDYKIKHSSESKNSDDYFCIPIYGSVYLDFYSLKSLLKVDRYNYIGVIYFLSFCNYKNLIPYTLLDNIFKKYSAMGSETSNIIKKICNLEIMASSNDTTKQIIEAVCVSEIKAHQSRYNQDVGSIIFGGFLYMISLAGFVGTGIAAGYAGGVSPLLTKLFITSGCSFGSGIFLMFFPWLREYCSPHSETKHNKQQLIQKDQSFIEFNEVITQIFWIKNQKLPTKLNNLYQRIKTHGLPKDHFNFLINMRPKNWDQERPQNSTIEIQSFS